MYPPHVFAANPLDRAEQERRDEEWIAKAIERPGSKFLPMFGLNPLIQRKSDASLGWLTRERLVALPANGPRPVLLGLLDGVAHFAVNASDLNDPTDDLKLEDGWQFEDARAAAADVSGPETGILAQARAQIDWHVRHRFCSVCGNQSEPRRGGQMRKCPVCGAEHFPRTDPVVIMLVYSGDKCILGQTRARSRSGFYSCLAGFMDQGEAIEEAVRREVREESGLELESIVYHSSQPWPFPSSLMIGSHAKAATEEVKFDAEEMTDVRWFTRDEVKAALRGEHPEINVPGPIAIAHHLIKWWADGNVK